MSKIKISVVSYLNSKPFIYGLQNSSVNDEIELELDIPSDCAKKLIENKVDIGLIPVAVLPEFKNAYVLSDFCIGAESKVASVCLYSQVPLIEIKEILLDYQSKTSVKLVQILSKELWKISPKWVKAQKKFENKIENTTAAVIIGDRTFNLEGKYQFKYDLAEEWIKLTGLPFVFACWVANKELPDAFIANFNNALKGGISAIDIVSESIKKEKKYPIDVKNYLTKNISYNFSEQKKQGMALFLEYLKKL